MPGRAKKSRVLVAGSLLSALMIIGCDSGDTASGPATDNPSANADMKAAIEKNRASSKQGAPAPAPAKKAQ